MGLEKKVEKAASDVLGQGETVRAVVKAGPSGALSNAAFRAGAIGGFGVVGARVADGMERPVAEAPGSGKIMAFAVTDRRILLLDLSTMTGSPRKVVATIALPEVESVTTGETRVMGIKTGTFTLRLAGGAESTWEVARAYRKDGDAVVAALQGAAG